MSATTQVRRLFGRSVSRYFALKILVEKGSSNILEIGQEIMKNCPIRYSLQAVTYSAWQSLKKSGFITLEGKNAKVTPSLTREIAKEIEYIERTIDKFNREGIFLKKSELGADEKEIDRRVAIIEILKRSYKGVKKQDLMRKLHAQVSSSQINEDIRAISEGLKKATSEDFVCIQVSNKGLWTEYYLPFRKIHFSNFA